MPDFSTIRLLMARCHRTMCRWWAWGCQQHEAGTTLSLARQLQTSCCYTSSLPQRFISRDSQQGATHSDVKSLYRTRYRVGFMPFCNDMDWLWWRRHWKNTNPCCWPTAFIVNHTVIDNKSRNTHTHNMAFTRHRFPLLHSSQWSQNIWNICTSAIQANRRSCWLLEEKKEPPQKNETN